MNNQTLTSRFNDALFYTLELHAAQVRKGSGVPYIAHLLGVTALVLEDGGDEDQAIAALLHDAVEDQGGLQTLNEIGRRFGDRVAQIVEGCTDAYTTPKPPWRKRKEQYLEHLHSAGPEVLRVSLADKLYNARSILDDLRRDEGENVWTRFNGGKNGSLWYYRSLAGFFQQASRSPMAASLAEVVSEIERIASQAA
ncbi:MAG TPA: HD domain-containing protein [Anaerolineales bacterium]